MIKSWVIDLLSLTDAHWRDYAFSREPLAGKIPAEQREDYHRKTVESALALAHRLRADYGSAPLDQIAKQLGVQLIYTRDDSTVGSKMFACYEEPNTITIFTENVEATDRLMVENDLNELIGSVRTADLLVAHELYHYLEHTQPDIYSAQKHLTLWKLGPIENRSRIFCLEEIGAMAFAKAMTGINPSPYIFEVLMLYPHSPQKAQKLFEHFMTFRAVSEES